MEPISHKIYTMQADTGGDETGRAGEVFVIDEKTGDSKPLPLCLEIKNHSPTGFAWGYGGSGPAQLALAILVDVAGKEIALQRYFDFKWNVIAHQVGSWSMREDYVRGWLAGRELFDEVVGRAS